MGGLDTEIITGGKAEIDGGINKLGINYPVFLKFIFSPSGNAVGGTILTIIVSTLYLPSLDLAKLARH